MSLKVILPALLVLVGWFSVASCPGPAGATSSEREELDPDQSPGDNFTERAEGTISGSVLRPGTERGSFYNNIFYDKYAVA